MENIPKSFLAKTYGEIHADICTNLKYDLVSITVCINETVLSSILTDSRRVTSDGSTECV